MVARGFSFFSFSVFFFQRTVRHACWWTHSEEGDDATKDTYFFASLTSQRKPRSRARTEELWGQCRGRERRRRRRGEEVEEVYVGRLGRWKWGAGGASVHAFYEDEWLNPVTFLRKKIYSEIHHSEKSWFIKDEFFVKKAKKRKSNGRVNVYQTSWFLRVFWELLFTAGTQHIGV